MVRKQISGLGKSRFDNRELCTLFIIAAGVTVSTLGPIAIQSLTMQPDLYDLAVRADTQSGNLPIIGWSGLPERLCDCRVQMLGDMMDSRPPIPDGTRVSNFGLAPDAATPQHP